VVLEVDYGSQERFRLLPLVHRNGQIEVEAHEDVRSPRVVGAEGRERGRSELGRSPPTLDGVNVAPAPRDHKVDPPSRPASTNPDPKRA
jgi:hypothetical protein